MIDYAHCKCCGAIVGGDHHTLRVLRECVVAVHHGDETRVWGVVAMAESLLAGKEGYCRDCWPVTRDAQSAEESAA